MFRPDSPLVTFLTHAFNFVMVNLLFMLCCLPVVTIGAAWSALYPVIANLVDDSSSSLGVFFETFREKFKTATKLWLPCMILYGLVITEVLFISNTYGSEAALPSGGIIQILLIVLCLLLFAVLCYAFPLIGMNDFTVKQAMSYSFYLAASNPVETLVMTVLNILPAALFFLYPHLAAQLLPVWALFAYSSVTWIDCKLIKKILKKHTSETGH